MSHRIHLGIQVNPRSVGHPETIRPGQRFFPRHGRRRRVLVVRTVKGQLAICRIENSASTTTVKVSRLLARDRRCEGQHYRWLGWVPRAGGYPTEGTVVDCDDQTVALELAEWGQRLKLVTWARFVPTESCRVGARVRLRANLGAKSPAELQAHGFEAVG